MAEDWRKYHSWSLRDLVERIKELEAENERLRGYGTVAERRPYHGGTLALEYRRNRRTGKRSGPYWSWHYLDDERRPKTIYIGRTDDPERALDEKLAERKERWA